MIMQIVKPTPYALLEHIMATEYIFGSRFLHQGDTIFRETVFQSCGAHLRFS